VRTLDASLLTVLDRTRFKPYLQLQYCIGNDFDWIDSPYDLLGYKLGGLELVVNTAGDLDFPWYAIRLLRGAVIGGTPVYEASSHYYVNQTFVTEKEKLELHATIVPKGTWRKYTADGNQTYQVIIDGICSYYGYTASYENPAAAFWQNIFLPLGRTLMVHSPFAVFTWLRQKLFIYGQDNNDDEIYFRQWLDDSLVGTVSHPSIQTLTTFDWKTQYDFNSRVVFWHDEEGVLHSYPLLATHPHTPLHNLGYLESTASTPAISQSWHQNEDKRTWHLQYQDGDILHCSSGTYQVKVFEVFDKKHSPELYLQFVALPKFSNTEGGAVPAAIEDVLPYFALNTSNFHAILDGQDNNIQAAMDSLDDHFHLQIRATIPTGHTAGIDFALDYIHHIFYIWDGTEWHSISGVIPPLYWDLLLENSDYFLLENGDRFLFG
jgi:hypothetical protein